MGIATVETWNSSQRWMLLVLADNRSLSPEPLNNTQAAFLHHVPELNKKQEVGKHHTQVNNTTVNLKLSFSFLKWEHFTIFTINTLFDFVYYLINMQNPILLVCSALKE